MAEQPVKALMDEHNFQVMAATTTVAVACAQLPAGQVLVVVDEHDDPVGLLTPELLLKLDNPAFALSTYRDHFLTATLTGPDTLLDTVLHGMLFGRMLGWVVVRSDVTVLGVIAPARLRVKQGTQPQTDAQPLTDFMQKLFAPVLESVLGLPGNPAQPPPTLCGYCPATDPPHRPAFYEIDWSNPTAPMCARHPGTRITILENPCQGS